MKMKACAIGLGCRGGFLVKHILAKHDDIEVAAVCDVYEDRVVNVVNHLRECGVEAKGYTDYKEALNHGGLEIAFVFTDWATHGIISIYAMEKGIPVASEVGCEYSLEACQDLVRTQEKTGTPYMFMENCCFGKEELLATSLVRHNVLGTIVHCAGAYAHDLRKEVAYGHVNRHYRFDNYLNRNAENYPTHELGPIAKVLDINRGNRILSVSSFASKSAGLQEYIQNLPDATEEMKNAKFKQGDIVTTVLTCANGETILLRLDTTLPRSYSRDFTIRGTKGSYFQDFHSVFLDGQRERFYTPSYISAALNNAKEYEAEYLPSLWRDTPAEVLAAGHGGMDWFAYDSFIRAVKNKTPVPIDVYDSATWQAVSVLSEASIAAGGMPQAMPDFTNGKWIKRPRMDVCDI